MAGTVRQIEWHLSPQFVTNASTDFLAQLVVLADIRGQVVVTGVSLHRHGDGVRDEDKVRVVQLTHCACDGTDVGAENSVRRVIGTHFRQNQLTGFVAQLVERRSQIFAVLATPGIRSER